MYMVNYLQYFRPAVLQSQDHSNSRDYRPWARNRGILYKNNYKDKDNCTDKYTDKDNDKDKDNCTDKYTDKDNVKDIKITVQINIQINIMIKIKITVQINNG